MRATQLARWRWLAAVPFLAILAAACLQDGTTKSATLSGNSTPNTAAVQTTAPVDEFISYRLGVFSDMTTDNFWEYYDSEKTFWNSYVLAPTKSALYRLNFPGIELTSDLAAGLEVPTGVAEGDEWAVEVEMREDARWSDGEPVTANDIVFTFRTVRDFELGGHWRKAYPLPDPDDPAVIGLTDVQAVADTVVKFVFNHRPGLAMWPHTVGFAPVMSEVAWGQTVEAASSSNDPAATLYAASGTELDVSSGPMIFAGHQHGEFARSVANPNFYDKELEVSSGGVEYTIGPFADQAIFMVYESQGEALDALETGSVDYLLNPLGIERNRLPELQQNPDLRTVVNRTYGFKYLAFNLRKEPMSIPAFREALALMIDKEFLANNLLQGAVFPLYATMPAGNVKWYNAEVAESFAAAYIGKTIPNRLEAAVQILKDAGFSWEKEPSVVLDADGDPLNAVDNGEGILFNGAPVSPLEILAPGPGYDPFRATYAVWIETWLNQLGFVAEANPTTPDELFAAVLPSSENTAEFDMFILGWDLGNPAFPDYYRALFYGPNDTLVNGGSNYGGYDSDEFDGLVEQYDTAQTEEQAYDLIWQMERVLFRDKPYIPLFDSGILEFYRESSVLYPFTQTLAGLQFLNGMQHIVRVAS